MEEFLSELIERSFIFGLVTGALLTTLVSRFVLLKYKKKLCNQMFMLNNRIVELYRLRQEEKTLDKKINEQKVKV